MDSIKPPEKFELKESDKNSETWRRLKKHINERINVLHLELEQDQPESKTAEKRGRIAAFKSLLSLDKTTN